MVMRMRQGRNGAVSVIALAERGALFDPGPCMCGLTLPALAESRDYKLGCIGAL